MTSSSDLLKKWQFPRHVRDLPPWPHFESGHLVEGHAAWRSKRPVLRAAACVGCLQCYLMCPDAAIRVHEGRLIWELLLCKGCGLCARECKHGAIVMEQEAL
jgi:pyruvate ferredoxin oxidoreductase delta subunit